ncbi:MAG: PQQ-binding-like beta-propeller repeat protein [Pirellulaceae bacterium]
MKTEDFIQALDKNNMVPAAIIARLRAKIEKTDKNVSAKSIAKYLIDKGYLSKYQAKQVFAGEFTPQDEMAIQVPEEQIHDTSELLADLAPPSATEAVDATRAYASRDPQAGYDASIEVVDVEHEVTMQQPLAGEPLDVTQAASLDPLGAGGHFDAGGFASVEAEQPKETFTGKKTKKNQWESKWIFIGSTIVGLLVIVGAILAFTLLKADSEKLWADANEDFNNARYSNAITKFTKYVASFPNDDNTPGAKVKIANCELRIPYDSKQWETTLVRAQTVLPGLYEELTEQEETERFGDLRPELGVILPGTAIGFTEAAINSDDVEVKKAQLDLALQARQLIDNPTYVPGSERRKPGVNTVLEQMIENIATIERQIQMENDYTSGLVSLRGLTERGDTRGAFEFADNLANKYPELQLRDGFSEALQAISAREADLVTTSDFEPVASELPATPINASVVLGTKSGQPKVAGLSTEMLVHLVNGSLYGVRAMDGHILWRQFVGLETEAAPVWLAEAHRSDVIAVDSRLQHVIRINPQDGSEVWRIGIGEAFANPNVFEDRVLVTTLSGKVLMIDAATGEISKAAQIPQTATVSGVMIPGEPYIYQLGNQANLYVISTETMTCREVYFVQHRASSVSVPPFIISGHLLVAENGANYCKLHIFKPTDRGLSLEEAQPGIRLAGQVNTPIFRYGRWGLVMSDEGDLRMLEINAANETEPLTVVVRTRFSNENTGRNYITAASGQLWTSGRGLRRYKIQKAAGEFTEQDVANNLDIFLAPSSLIEETLFHVRRRHDSSMVSVSAVNSETLEEIWRNDFAAPLAGPPLTDDSRLLAVSAQGDIFEVDNAEIEAGVDNEPLIRGNTVVQSLIFNNVMKFGEAFVMTGPLDRKNVLTIDFQRDPPNSLSNFQSGVLPSCRPVRFGDHLLVATTRGQVFRINVLSGASVGAPFQPPLEPNTETVWREPAILADGQQFIIGDANGRLFLVQADGDNSLQKMHELQLDGTLVSPLVSVGDMVLGVRRSDTEGDQLIAIPVAEQIEITQELSLPGGYVAGPIKVADDRFLLLVDTGETVCIDTAMNQVWSAQLPPEAQDRMAGQPVAINGQIMMAFESGRVLAVDPASGDVTNSWDLGQPISHPPVELAGQLYVAGADGTLHRLDQLSP